MANYDGEITLRLGVSTDTKEVESELSSLKNTVGNINSDMGKSVDKLSHSFSNVQKSISEISKSMSKLTLPDLDSEMDIKGSLVSYDDLLAGWQRFAYMLRSIMRGVTDDVNSQLAIEESNIVDTTYRMIDEVSQMTERKPLMIEMKADVNEFKSDSNVVKEEIMSWAEILNYEGPSQNLFNKLVESGDLESIQSHIDDINEKLIQMRELNFNRSDMSSVLGDLHAAEAAMQSVLDLQRYQTDAVRGTNGQYTLSEEKLSALQTKLEQIKSNPVQYWSTGKNSLETYFKSNGFTPGEFRAVGQQLRDAFIEGLALSNVGTDGTMDARWVLQNQGLTDEEIEKVVQLRNAASIASMAIEAETGALQNQNSELSQSASNLDGLKTTIMDTAKAMTTLSSSSEVKQPEIVNQNEVDRQQLIADYTQQMEATEQKISAEVERQQQLRSDGIGPGYKLYEDSVKKVEELTVDLNDLRNLIGEVQSMSSERFGLEQQLTTAIDKSEEYERELARLETRLSELYMSRDVESDLFQGDIQNSSRLNEELQNTTLLYLDLLRQVSELGVANDQLVKGQMDIEAATRRVIEAEMTIQSLKSQLTDVQGSPKTDGDKSYTVDILKAKLEAARQEVDAAKEALELTKERYKMMMEVPGVADLSAKIRETEKQLTSLGDKLNQSNEYANMSEEEIENINSEIRTTLGLIDDVNSKLQDNENVINDISNDISDMDGGGGIEPPDDGTTGGWQSLNEVFRVLPANLRSCVAPITQFSSKFGEIGLAVGIAIATIKLFIETIKWLIREFKNFVDTISTVFSKLQQIGHALGSVASSIKDFVSNGVQGFKSFGEHIVTAVNNMKELPKRINSSSLSLKKLINFITRYGLGLRSTYMLVRKVRSAVVDAFKTIAQLDNETNASLSGVTSAFNQLKGQIAASFAPLINLVAPILIKIINLATQAALAVGKVIAALTGHNTVKVATYQYKDYAASLDKSTKSTKKNTDAMKKQLASFDELNNLTSNEDTDSDSGKSGSGSDPGFGLSEAPIEDKWKNLADMIKNAWKTGDFFELGKMLGDKLAEALGKIDWNKVKAQARKIGKSLATFINGFLSGSFDGKSLGYWIGNTLGESLNTAFEFLCEFAQDLDWELIGSFIGDTLMRAFDVIDWELIFRTFRNLGEGIARTINTLTSPKYQKMWEGLGNTISNALTAVLAGILKFLTTLNGYQIGRAIQSIFMGIHFDQIMYYLVSNLNMLATKIIEILTTIPFADIGRRMASGLVSAINTLSPTEIGTAIGLIIQNAITWLKSLLDTLQGSWGELGQKIGSNIVAACKQIKSSDIADILKNILNGALNLVNGALSKLPSGQELGSNFASFLNDLINDIPSEEIGNTLYDLIHRCVSFVATTLSETDFGELSTKFFSLLNTVLTNKDENGNTLAQNIGSLVGTALTKAADFILSDDFDAFVENIKTSIEDGFKSAKDNVDRKKVGDAIGELIKAVLEIGWTWAKEKLKAKFNIGELFAFEGKEYGEKTFGWVGDIVSSVTPLGPAVKRTVGHVDTLWTAFHNLSVNSSSASTEVQSSFQGIESTASNVFSSVTGLWTSTEQSASTSASGIQTAFNSVSDISEQAVNVVSNGINQMQTSTTTGVTNTNTALKSVETTSSETVSRLSSDATATSTTVNNMTSNITGLTTTVSGVSDVVGTELSNASTTAKTEGNKVGESILTGIGEGMKNTSPITTAIQQMFVAIQNSTVQSFNTLKSTCTTQIQTLASTISNRLDDIKTLVNNFFTNVKSTVINNLASINTTNGQSLSTMISNTKDKLDNLHQVWEKVFSKIKQTVTKVINDITNTITGMVDKIISAFDKMGETISDMLSGVGDSFESMIKPIFLSLLDSMQSAINSGIDGFNSAIDELSKAGVEDTPSHINHVELPGLAKGGVIPANHEFLAILGDQTHGTNIETPLSTMVEAFNMALDRRGGFGASDEAIGQIISLLGQIYEKDIVADDSGIFRTVRGQAKLFKKSTGNDAFSFN